PRGGAVETVERDWRIKFATGDVNVAKFRRPQG
ncbi:MAG: hypothetical protein ACI9HK_005946, partial [Pirellulaceae bacterium]